eukprot:TRINITY_DN12568_c0_g8_i2.p1 TRINITY_DN12568_c0_g8~~TRINITY_DN12568_c0_g8_i2.p1  ORF type:complete len:205 (-),score=60.96 TRINITY_DN12568_c0_g8_i2:633-1247(-)
MSKFCSTIEALAKYSESAKVFVLIHKMDTVPECDREKVFEEKKQVVLEKAGLSDIQVFMTSIWDETLYQAWSKITHSLIPKINMIETGLKQLCAVTESDELVLFEKSTFLEIAHIKSKAYKDPHRFEKISNIIKQFKLSLFGTNYKFEEMSVKNSKFRAYLINFTKSTYLMVVLSNRDVEEEVLKMNVNALRPYYTKIVAATLS